MKRYMCALLFVSFFGLLSFFSCFPIDDAAEGSVENPVEITTTPHRGFVGYGYRRVSYYTFLSTSMHPTISYDHLSVGADLDCEVYTNPDFHTDQIPGSNGLSENNHIISSGDYTDRRLYVKIINYSNDEDVEFDIYYWATN